MSCGAVDADPDLEVRGCSSVPEHVDLLLDDDPACRRRRSAIAAKMPGAPVPSRSVQNGASTLFGRRRIRPGRQVAAVVVLGRAAAGDEVAVGVDADGGVGHAVVHERRDVEVEDVLVADRDRRRRRTSVEREVAGRAAPGSTDGTPGCGARRASRRAVGAWRPFERPSRRRRRRSAARSSTWRVRSTVCVVERVVGRRRRRTSVVCRTRDRCPASQDWLSVTSPCVWTNATGRCSVGARRCRGSGRSRRTAARRSARRTRW